MLHFVSYNYKVSVKILQLKLKFEFQINCCIFSDILPKFQCPWMQKLHNRLNTANLLLEQQYNYLCTPECTCLLVTASLILNDLRHKLINYGRECNTCNACQEKKMRTSLGHPSQKWNEHLACTWWLHWECLDKGQVPNQTRWKDRVILKNLFTKGFTVLVDGNKTDLAKAVPIEYPWWSHDFTPMPDY
jgi:hypothetical protein